MLVGSPTETSMNLGDGKTVEQREDKKEESRPKSVGRAANCPLEIQCLF